MYGQGDVLSLDPEECAIGSSVHGICRGHCDFCQNFQPWNFCGNGLKPLPWADFSSLSFSAKIGTGKNAFFPSDADCKSKTKLSAEHQADSAPRHKWSLWDLHPACSAQREGQHCSWSYLHGQGASNRVTKLIKLNLLGDSVLEIVFSWLLSAFDTLQDAERGKDNPSKADISELIAVPPKYRSSQVCLRMGWGREGGGC